MPTQASLPEVPDTTLTMIENLPAVAKAQQEYVTALRSLRDAVRGNPALTLLVLDLDGYAGARAYYQLAGGYAVGIHAAV